MDKFKREWDDFKDKVIPQSAGPLQVSETRKAFYSGALAIISLLSNMFTSDREVTEQDIEDYDLLVKEVVAACETFFIRNHEMS